MTLKRGAVYLLLAVCLALVVIAAFGAGRAFGIREQQETFDAFLLRHEGHLILFLQADEQDTAKIGKKIETAIDAFEYDKDMTVVLVPPPVEKGSLQ